MSTPRARSIAILITTYQRNGRLLRLVGQWLGFINEYQGPHRYFVCVADSDPNNHVKLPAGVARIVNTGQGFDDNLTGALRALVGASDHIFAMGDDDLPSPFVNPLYLIDAGLAGEERDALLFNHVSYVEKDELELGDRYFRVGETVNLAVLPLSILTTRLPRYTGIVYRTAFVQELLPQLAAFRGTLHAYAVPLLIAAVRGRFRFIDYPICLFDRADKHDGAWIDDDRVTAGLRQFLAAMQPLLPEADHAQMQAGFQRNYFDGSVRAGPWRAAQAAEPVPA